MSQVHLLVVARRSSHMTSSFTTTGMSLEMIECVSEHHQAKASHGASGMMAHFPSWTRSRENSAPSHKFRFQRPARLPA